MLDFQTEAYVMSSASCLSRAHVRPRWRIVMEFVGGGDLYRLLHPDSKRLAKSDAIAERALPWLLRLRMALDIARGMRFLAEMQPPMIHRDVRSPNILFVASLDSAAGVCRRFWPVALRSPHARRCTQHVAVDGSRGGDSVSRPQPRFPVFRPARRSVLAVPEQCWFLLWLRPVAVQSSDKIIHHRA
eukprot:TRINITY_DN1594_c0_g3_i1.p4 TRINITY_DN1594_c0_g3~~TRINITY_DN1594_c0_g3_i1.p4  ORF type:complete len:187 (-),score=19.57 TRINITY_DN1594_c0_g3_i1:2437-2997(-)